MTDFDPEPDPNEPPDPTAAECRGELMEQEPPTDVRAESEKAWSHYKFENWIREDRYPARHSDFIAGFLAAKGADHE